MLAILVIAKAPVAGQVKTRLCPPCTPAQAAAVAEAALLDTLAAADRTPAARRTLVLQGSYPTPPTWSVVPQRGLGLAERLVNAFGDAGSGSGWPVLIGMDTPQVTPALLRCVGDRLAEADVVLAPAVDGGWWALGLRDPGDAALLADVPMSTSDTGRLTTAAFRRHGLRVVAGPRLRDVDTARDARLVAMTAPHGRFAAAVRRHVPDGSAG